jgi:hypothetical protein
LAKAELERQCEIGVLQKVYESEWGMPMLVIPKKDRVICTCADIQELNKQTVRLTYPLPRIHQNIFQERQGYKFLTKIDLTLCFILTSSTTRVPCTVSSLHPLENIGTFVYQWDQQPFLGTQTVLEEIFDDALREIECFIDDIGIFDNVWEKHHFMIDLVLSRLKEHGFG